MTQTKIVLGVFLLAAALGRPALGQQLDGTLKKNQGLEHIHARVPYFCAAIFLPRPGQKPGGLFDRSLQADRE